MGRLILLLSALFFFSARGIGQEVSFRVEVTPDTVRLGTRFEVAFELENANGTEFQAPPFSDFVLMGGPNTSSSFSMLNGKVTRSLSYSYILEAKEIGSYYIQPASILVDGAIMETAPVEIWVLPGEKGLEQPQEGKKKKRKITRI